PPPPPSSAPMPMPSAPPPPTSRARSASVPMPAAMAMPEMMPQAKRSGGFGSMLGGAVEAMGAAFGGGGSEGGYAEPTASLAMPEPEPELLAGRELLDYGRLRLYPGSDAR